MDTIIAKVEKVEGMMERMFRVVGMYRSRCLRLKEELKQKNAECRMLQEKNRVIIESRRMNGK